MIYFNAKRVFELRGIKPATTFLRNIGFSRKTASNIARNNVSNIKLEHLEKICLALHCTPNDFFEWKPDAQQQIIAAENHPLKALVRDKPAPNFNRLVREIPIDKLEKVDELLNQLK